MFTLFTKKKADTGSKKEKEEAKKEYIDTSDIQEFYYMISAKNLPSILEKGILSHSRVGKAKAKGLKSEDISNQDVQTRREKPVPYYGRKTTSSPVSLHRFANLYLNPHNAMMAVVAPKTEDLCVLRISREILERGDVILTSQNAATDKATFKRASSWRLSPESSSYLSKLSRPTYTELQEQKKMKAGADLYSKDRGAFDKQYSEGASAFFAKKEAVDKPKQVRQAEALVRSKIDPRFIKGIFVPDETNEEAVKQVLEESKRKDISVTQHLSLFIGYKKSYQDLSPFEVPKLTTSLKGDDDYGYLDPWDSDEETPSSSSSMSSSSSS